MLSVVFFGYGALNFQLDCGHIPCATKQCNVCLIHVNAGLYSFTVYRTILEEDFKKVLVPIPWRTLPKSTTNGTMAKKDPTLLMCGGVFQLIQLALITITEV